MNVLFLSDFFVDEVIGGAELVDETVINYLKNQEKINLICKKSFNVTKEEIKNSDFIILSNISLINQNLLSFIKDNKKYLILEHDYKIHNTRQPWRYKDSIIPTKERCNYDLYLKAKAVFLQTSDHLNIFKDNDVEANFISLKSSIWSDEELTVLESLQNNKNTHKFAIVDSDNWIKNKEGAVNLCKANKIDYNLIPKLPYNQFLHELSKHPALVFFPIARETCCRLLVEARCMNMNVLTSDNSGAFKSEWFTKSGGDLILYLKQQTKINFQNIKNYVN